MSWTTYKLSELCDVFTDGDWIESKDQSPEGIRLLQTGNIGIGVFKERIDKARYVSEETFKRLNCEEVFEGDLLISRLPEPVGRGCLIPNITGRAITAVDCTILRVKSDLLDKRYLEYFIQSQPYQSEIQSKVTGTTRQRISRKNLGEIPIVFPPLPVQKQIVEKLDVAFADIDKAISATERSIENAEAFRQKTIDELMTFKHTSNTTITKEIDMLPGYAFKSAQYVDDEDGITLLRGDNLKPNAIDFTEAKKYPKESTKEYGKFHLQENDIVIGMDRPWISSGLRTAMIKKADLPCLLVQRVMRMRCPTTINPKFFYLHLQASSFLSHILGKETGLGVPHISGKTIGSFEFFIPELKKQNEIVYIFSSVDSNIHKLKKSYISKLSNYEALKSSILNQAFSGELTKDAA